MILLSFHKNICWLLGRELNFWVFPDMYPYLKKFFFKIAFNLPKKSFSAVKNAARDLILLCNLCNLQYLEFWRQFGGIPWVLLVEILPWVFVKLWVFAWTSKEKPVFKEVWAYLLQSWTAEPLDRWNLESLGEERDGHGSWPDTWRDSDGSRRDLSVFDSLLQKRVFKTILLVQAKHCIFCLSLFQFLLERESRVFSSVSRNLEMRLQSFLYRPSSLKHGPKFFFLAPDYF